MASLSSTKPSTIRPNQPKSRPTRVLKWLACTLLIGCAVLLAASVWTAAEPSEVPAASAASNASEGTSSDLSNTSSEVQTGSPSDPNDFDVNGRLTIEEGARPTANEIKIARKLADELRIIGKDFDISSVYVP